MKEILAATRKLSLQDRVVNLANLKDDLKNCCIEGLENKLDKLKKAGLIEENSNRITLTDKGRQRIKVVVCGGVYDILHPGHTFILNEAKSFGDVLVVIVARDSTVERRKRIPIVPEAQRVEMVGQLKPVDASVIGYEGDPFKIIEDIKPNVIALGPDQHHDEDKIKNELGMRGIEVEVKRIKEYKECELNSTKAILQRIIERGYPDSRGGG
jgi:FAD synthetase